jgi:hypothetical protein
MSCQRRALTVRCHLVAAAWKRHATAALLPSFHLTRTTRVPARPRRRHARPGQPAALTGRQGARLSFWDATFLLLPLPSAERSGRGGSSRSVWQKAHRPEPPYVFGAAGAPSDNRNNRTSRRLRSIVASRLNKAFGFPSKKKSTEGVNQGARS